MNATIGIACNTIKDEIILVANRLKSSMPIVWIESGQHQTPEKLSKALQEQIDQQDNVENILLLFGSCGNCLYGLKSASSNLIFPRVDDCISLFLGGNDGKKELEAKGHAYYVTKGYLDNEANIWQDYKHCFAKYGEKKARRIMQVMLKNYQKLRVIETGAFELDRFVAETETIADLLELEHEVVPGTLRIIDKALRGEWDEDFVTVLQGQAVNYRHLGLIGGPVL